MLGSTLCHVVAFACCRHMHSMQGASYRPCRSRSAEISGTLNHGGRWPVPGLQAGWWCWVQTCRLLQRGLPQASWSQPPACTNIVYICRFFFTSLRLMSSSPPHALHESNTASICMHAIPCQRGLCRHCGADAHQSALLRWRRRLDDSRGLLGLQVSGHVADVQMHLLHTSLLSCNTWSYAGLCSEHDALLHVQTFKFQGTSMHEYKLSDIGCSTDAVAQGTCLGSILRCSI